ncbi:hypothetical protein CFC21_020103 [Triticum aestivum]|uniref:NB-ARC domain-containing protein n=3 Tax=Triticum aestivum TaxID=4565 RepID=A0A3B6B8W8_WHEAT|nr:hypothetical protein CFC21_020103 [Triticum aestivum]
MIWYFHDDTITPASMSLSATIGAISGFNECVTFWQWARSAISSLHSQWSGSQEQDLQSRVLQLESGLQVLRDTLPAMHDLINKAEWSHDDAVAKILPNLKDAVFDAEDLIDEFRWYEKKVQAEGNASQSPSIDFFDTVIQDGFNKLDDVQLRLSSLSSQMESMGLRGVAQRFDKLVRPETTSFPSETKIFGRDKELKQVLEFLNVPINSKRKRATSSVNASTSTAASNHFNSESSLPVLVMDGFGGVGKTTLAQHICSHKGVRSHFKKIIWICVSDDFDVKRLTKEVIQSFTGKEATAGNLNTLQEILSNHVNNKRLLIVLDDVWDDALKENGQCWKKFCAPFRSAQEGSAMLVTTRCPNVRDGVRTMEPVRLDGLDEDIFWNFFKLCAFGSEESNNDPDLEGLGRSIVPKLKGSPLAAKTLGRMLKANPEVSHWKSILESELWRLHQEKTEILPALRLSYMYLPFKLKRCFAFCAIYPKDYKFDKEHLAEIWAAEGFVEPQGGVPIHDVGCQYFEDLVARSFFQKVGGQYVIHDLLHDMAQKVSEDDCFILRNTSDFAIVPQNVRHLYVLPSSEFDHSNLPSLCNYTKLRTLICKKSLGRKADIVMESWCDKLLRMRVMSCASADKLPDNIGNWKHLRYLEISRACSLKKIPSTFCWLYHMQILYAKKCKLEIPGDFVKLTSLQKFEAIGLTLDSANKEGQGIRLIKNLNQIRGYLVINNLAALSKDQAAEAELKNKKYLDRLTLNMHSPWGFGMLPTILSASCQAKNKEVLEVLQPPISLKSLLLQNYGDSSLPSWFQPPNLPSLESLTFQGCDGLNSINLKEIPAFLSLADVKIEGCKNISSLEDFPPGIKKIVIKNCEMLESVPTEKCGDFDFLEEMSLFRCPNIRLQGLVSQSLKELVVWDSGLFCNINCCSLTEFSVSSKSITSIQLQTWSLPALRELRIQSESLASIGGIGAFSSLKVIKFSECRKLPTLDGLLTQEHLPAIERIEIRCCSELKSLPAEWFPYLKHLVVDECTSLKWQTGFVLPSCLQSLRLKECGDISPCIPSCLENLTSLVSLEIEGFNGIKSIPGNVWHNYLVSLEKLVIKKCQHLVSIGGAEVVANIKEVEVRGCPKLEEADQINSTRRTRRTR